MPSLKKLYGFDRSKAENGVWVTLQEAQVFEDGTVVAPAMRVKLGRIGSLAYNKALEKAMAPYRTKIRLTRGMISPEDQVKIAIQTYADSIVFDWEGITDDDDNPLPCTRANKVQQLTDLPDFRTAVEAYAGDAENFQEDIEIDSKNSRTISATSVVSEGEDSTS